MVIYLRLEQNKSDAAVAQSVERRIGSAEVTGPIPVSSFCKSLEYSRLFYFCMVVRYILICRFVTVLLPS